MLPPVSLAPTICAWALTPISNKIQTDNSPRMPRPRQAWRASVSVLSFQGKRLADQLGPSVAGLTQPINASSLFVVHASLSRSPSPPHEAIWHNALMVPDFYFRPPQLRREGR